nr:aconitase family protein [Spirochaetota bacterium]
DFLKRQGREKDFVEIKADEGCEYDEVLNIDLSKIKPMAAAPHSPDNVFEISEIEDTFIDQVAIGSCTNSSYRDLWYVAKILEGKVAAKNVSLAIAPGSKQVLSMIAKDGSLSKLIDAGARILESTCGPCIGMGQAPNSKGTTLRTFNRNFEGRSGTKDANVYLVGPEVAAYSALLGRIANPQDLGDMPKFTFPEEFNVDDRMIIPPSFEPEKVQIKRGPGIKPLPEQKPLSENIEAKVVLKVENNITTDHILPAGAKVLPFRSDIPKISEFTFGAIDPDFHKKAKDAGVGIIVGGENYGQGSSREHAALAPKYLGIVSVIVKSFARIHKANLINFGIIPLTFENPEDYDLIKENDIIRIPNIREQIKENLINIEAYVFDKKINLRLEVSINDREQLIAGGKLAYIKNKFGG